MEVCQDYIQKKMEKEDICQLVVGRLLHYMGMYVLDVCFNLALGPSKSFWEEENVSE